MLTFLITFCCFHALSLSSLCHFSVPQSWCLHADHTPNLILPPVHILWTCFTLLFSSSSGLVTFISYKNLIEVKGKVVPVLNKVPCHEDISIA